jgi:uncharacterized protein YceK
MKNIVAKTLCLGALLLPVSSAHAVLNFNFNVIQSSFLPDGGQGTTGWNVIMRSTDALDTVWVVDSITAMGGTFKPLEDATTINFTFTTGLNGSGSIVQGTPGGTGGVNNPGFNNWDYQPGTGLTGIKFDTGLSNTVLSANAGPTDTFKAGFTLANGNAKSLLVNIQGPTGQWQGLVSPLGVTPELPGSALLSVALLPLGLVLRKRMA